MTKAGYVLKRLQMHLLRLRKGRNIIPQTLSLFVSQTYTTWNTECKFALWNLNGSRTMEFVNDIHMHTYRRGTFTAVMYFSYLIVDILQGNYILLSLQIPSVLPLDNVCFNAPSFSPVKYTRSIYVYLWMTHMLMEERKHRTVIFGLIAA